MQKVAVSASLRLHMTEQDHTPKSDKNRDMTKHYKSKEAGDFFEGIGTDLVPTQNLFCIQFKIRVLT
jgi:hypothetical protein